ncbi:amidohydrolase [Aliikangiella marina]|uniref:Amidohydrolase n=1 Tax=Aliikangiella marina TaxID=1712262 RepID=A0A545THP8_9GAMM|nr:amidohydrolase [Aliikangiella marina]TQV76759.1 amidohydrolase [Aliikangiella marina]
MKWPITFSGRVINGATGKGETVKKAIAFLLSVLIVACSQEVEQSTSDSSQQVEPIDLILTNGSVYSFNWRAPDGDGNPATDAPYQSGWQPDAQAIAIDDGLIVAVGTNQVIRQMATAQTQIVDLEGATVLPGFHDSHVHIAELGQILSRINLIDVKTPQEAIDQLLKATKAIDLGPNEWVIGQGWDEGAWANAYPTKALLDKHFPNNPVLLKSLHGFAVWVNSAALGIAQIDHNTQPPIGGEIVKDLTGEPTGILLNRATTLIQNKVPDASNTEFQSWVKKGMQQMLKDGFVAVHQAGAETKHISAFQALNQAQELPLRTYAMLSARDESLAKEWITKGPLIDPSGWLDIRSVKAYYDGALGSRGARLLEDYSDRPGHRGVSGEGYGFDESLVEALMRRGFQVGIHAIGDAGNRETLDFLQKVMTDFPETRNLRHRIEHAQVLHPDDLSRLANLKLIASMEPQHAVEDKTWAESRVGSERIKGAYAWRKLKQAGTQMTLNSDLPGSDHSLFYGLHSAVTRQDKQSQPAGGWYPQENLTIEEAVRGFTIDAAFSAFHENDTGVIAKGKWADLTIVDIDVMQVAEKQPHALLTGQVLMTVLDGKIVYRKESFSED